MTTLQRNPMSLVLQTLRGDEPLDLGSFGVRLLALALRLHFTADHEFADLSTQRISHTRFLSYPNLPREARKTYIIIFRQAKETTNLSRPLGAQPLGVHGIRQAGDIVVALLDDGQGQHRQVHGDDASAHALALALAGPTRPVAAVAVAQEQPDARRVHDALLHREALLVVAAGDLEDVALELVADAVAGHFGPHPAVHEHPELALVFDFDQFLRPVGREGDVQLHLDGVWSRWRR